MVRELIWGKRADGTPLPHKQLFLLPHLAKRMRTIEIIDDDVTMTVETAMVIEEIKEVVGVVAVVDMSSGTKTKVRPVSPVLSLT